MTFAQNERCLANSLLRHSLKSCLLWAWKEIPSFNFFKASKRHLFFYTYNHFDKAVLFLPCVKNLLNIHISKTVKFSKVCSSNWVPR